MIRDGGIQPIRALALMAGLGQRIPVKALSVGDDGELSVASPAPPARFHFTYQGVRFGVVVTPQDGRFGFRMTARVGVIPYSAQNRKGRLALLTILRYCRSMTVPRLVVAQNQTIWMVAELDVDGMPSPDAVLFEVVRILWTARPYLDLIASCI